MVRQTWVQSQVTSYQKLLKWYLILPCLTLSNTRYISRIKWNNQGKGEEPSPTPRCSSDWKGSLLVALDYGRQLYLLYFKKDGALGYTFARRLLFMNSNFTVSCTLLSFSTILKIIKLVFTQILQYRTESLWRDSLYAVWFRVDSSFSWDILFNFFFHLHLFDGVRYSQVFVVFLLSRAFWRFSCVEVFILPSIAVFQFSLLVWHIFHAEFHLYIHTVYFRCWY